PRAWQGHGFFGRVQAVVTASRGVWMPRPRRCPTGATGALALDDELAPISADMGGVSFRAGGWWWPESYYPGSAGALCGGTPLAAWGNAEFPRPGPHRGRIDCSDLAIEDSGPCFRAGGGPRCRGMTDAGRDGTTGVRSLAASTDLDD